MPLRTSTVHADAARPQGLRVFLVHAYSPGEYAFVTDQAGLINLFTAASEGGPDAALRRLALYIDGVPAGADASVAAGATAGGGAAAVPVTAGQAVRVLSRGGSTTLSGVLQVAGALPTLYRLRPASPVAGRWRMVGGVWRPVRSTARQTSAGWDGGTTYRKSGGAWPVVSG
ncbi:MAG TPA: hypothetical protein VFJ16_31230 [Longimicrobium sp.]|nr:hypothetical protein [Longimicrobium sp.]